ncbi:hypothetical protein ABIF44_002715 [Bradyrhizobium japonicum]|nr:hypothetical protein [Bradyrhizobium japonicum]MCS3979454.1 hypothetical protein [Bradyrhizobium japonicum]MCS3990981.1 hypothetical protein [Bradyrhizobium japonicum]MCS4014209.1 hypothetical protein [Bradyrhizobium japonicum]MCS4210214.1 hypothetical protein [Bradyrhizobium japonicum]
MSGYIRVHKSRGGSRRQTPHPSELVSPSVAALSRKGRGRINAQALNRYFPCRSTLSFSFWFIS